MFKLQSSSSSSSSRPTNRTSNNSKSRERLDFKFSNFQALQVPKGWDRLFLSLISVETGKTIAKLSKVLVRNGTCQWPETLSESFLISRDDSSNEYDQSLIKIVVSTGSTRSTTLGEATINVAHYTTSRDSASFSQPLTKCSHGTLLQLKIQCLTPRTKLRSEESKYSTSQEKDVNHYLGSQSNGSDISNDSNVGPQAQDGDFISHPPKLDTKETSQFASSPNSFGSTDGSVRRKTLLRKNALKTVEYDSNEIQIGGDLDSGQIHDNDEIRADNSILRKNLQNETSVKSSFGSSRNHLEAAGETIEALRAEAKMWERNARKLMIDLDMSRKEFSKLSKNQAGLVIELSASREEYDSLKRETEQVKQELEKFTLKQANKEDPTIQSERLIQMQKALENEIKYHQDMNANLDQQLKCTQESNIELISVLQELEETIEQQKFEIEKLSSLKMDNKTLQDGVQLLEEALRNKSIELENERKSNSEYKYKISVMDEEIEGLQAKLSSNVNDENYVDLIRKVESLKEKNRELEKDCTELTDENLELLIKLKDSNKADIRKCASFNSMSSENLNNSPSDDSDVSDPKFQYEEAKMKTEEKYAELMVELDERRSEVDLIKTSLLSKEEEVDLLLRNKKELEIKVSEVQERSNNLEQNMRIALRENNTVSEKKLEKLVTEKQELERNLSVSEDEIQKMNVEMDIQIFYLKQKSEEMETQLLESVDECEYLKVEFLNLQASAGNLVEDNVKLQKSNSELKMENQELHEHCSVLVAQLNGSRKSLSKCDKKVEMLENKLTSLLNDMALRENSLKSELDALVQETSNEKEKLYLDEMEVIKNELDAIKFDYESRVKELTCQLADSQQSYEMLNADHERILKSLAFYKKSEAKIKMEFKMELNDLESKLTISDYEREQLFKEMGVLKVQLQNIPDLQDKISSLKCELEECRLDYEELKAEKVSLTEMIFSLNNAMSEFEDCKSKKLALEEKILQMENELSMKEILQTQKDELQNELTKIKRANTQFQQKIYKLEEEKEACLKKAQPLEENIESMKGENEIGEKVVPIEKYERTKSSFETELRDLRERYLKMSLKYAEVEAEREGLVMKLKATRSGKKLFG